MSAVETALRSKGSLLWAYATIISVSVTLLALQVSDVRAETFDFTFSGTSSAGGGPGSILGGVITGSGGIKTNISGTASGMSSLGFNGYFSFSASDAYLHASSPGIFNTYTYTSSSSYQFNYMKNDFLSFFFDRGGTNSMCDCPNDTFVTDATGYKPTFLGSAVVTSSSLAAPEIDGSVVPRAAFVMMGLFWIFKSRQRRLHLAEA